MPESGLNARQNGCTIFARPKIKNSDSNLGQIDLLMLTLLNVFNTLCYGTNQVLR